MGPPRVAASLPDAAAARCHTCGRPPVGTFQDGSPRYDHGHRPDGTTWEAEPATAPVLSRPLALLMDRERFTGRNGRRWERWAFVAWTASGPAEATGVTSTLGTRRRQWDRNVSPDGWCRVELDEHGVRDVFPRASGLSEPAIAHYADMADDLERARAHCDPERANDDDPMPDGWDAA